MTEEQQFQLLYDYQYAPYRVLQRILWVDENEGAVVEWGRRCGNYPTFWTFTYANVDDLAQCRKDWSKVLRRLIQMYPDLCGVRVNQFGTKKGRFHMHAVFDRELPLDKVRQCLRGTTFGHQFDVKRVRDDNLGGYLWRDMAKDCRRQGMGRHFSVFGIFEGKTRLKDITYWKNEEFAECQEVARGESFDGEHWRRAWERGWRYYLEGQVMKAGQPWEPWCEREWRLCAGIERQEWGGKADHGDAYEDGQGDTDFDVEGLEKGTGADGGDGAGVHPPPVPVGLVGGDAR